MQISATIWSHENDPQEIRTEEEEEDEEEEEEEEEEKKKVKIPQHRRVIQRACVKGSTP